MRIHRADIRLHLVTAMNQALDLEAGADPLDVIVGDHFRMRAMLGLVRQLARPKMSSVAREILGRTLLAFLHVDFERHLKDEERGLFPLLAPHLGAGDLAMPSLRRLVEEHEAGRAMASRLEHEALHFLATPEFGPSEAFRRAAAAFARDKQRHVAIENAVVIPLARERLAPRDMRRLARAMAEHRRGARSGGTPTPAWSLAVAGRC